MIQQLDPGMGQAVAARTVFRESDNNEWANVGVRVAAGNTSLVPTTTLDEQERLKRHLQAAAILLSGRHLQHGDEHQSKRAGEVFTNCSTSAMSFIKKYLLLNGSGVGRAYDDALMIVNWALQPYVFTTIGIVPECEVGGVSIHSGKYLTPGLLHPEAGTFKTKEEMLERYPHATVFLVPDSREGWAKTVELIENAAWRKESNHVLILDFSGVRPKGAPIGGMQDRPSSGPLPLMQALNEINSFKNRFDMQPWEQTIRVDHILADVVLVGGARRSARIATKWWKDKGIYKFITIKQEGGLWSANNSVSVDQEFWQLVRSAHKKATEYGSSFTPEEAHAYQLFLTIVDAQYNHGSGEPGFINVDKITSSDEGMEIYDDGIFAGNDKFSLSETSVRMGKMLFSKLQHMDYHYIVNPCGEIRLLVTGGYCVIGDLAPYFSRNHAEIIEAGQLMARALIRTNQMQFLYGKETKRTNRIGVSLTGIQEFAWKFYGLAFRDLLDDTGVAKDFWLFLQELGQEVIKAADAYADELGVVRPHTVLTIKPAGTTSKLFGLTEGAHLSPMLWYLRWVQFRHDSPLVAEYEAKGYPVVRNIRNAAGEIQYSGTTIVGFPTVPLIGRLGIPEDRLVTAPDATMEEQFRWVTLLEKYWLGTERGNQVSYTLKYRREDISLEEYTNTLVQQMPEVSCISVMPTDDWRVSQEKYGYVPEEPISYDEYLSIIAGIKELAEEAIDMETLKCASGVCPI